MSCLSSSLVRVGETGGCETRHNNSVNERNIYIVCPDNEPMATSCVFGPLDAHLVFVAHRYEAFCSTGYQKNETMVQTKISSDILCIIKQDDN